jgi:hypothetical protein
MPDAIAELRSDGGSGMAEAVTADQIAALVARRRRAGRRVALTDVAGPPRLGARSPTGRKYVKGLVRLQR